MGFIYLRTNKINGKKYVGQVTTKRFKTRQNNWKNLKQPYAGPAINAARAKYGIEAFGFEILKECNNNELDYWEKYYIKELNTKAPYGYNLTDGGDGMSGYSCPPRTEEWKEKQREAHKGKKLSEEHKKKISDANKGKKKPPVTEETRKKMSESRKGEKHWNYRKHLSDEHKNKIGKGNKGKHRSEEQKIKLSKLNRNGKSSKPILQMNKNTNEVIKEFPSIREIQRQFGFYTGVICECCNGKRKTAYGYIWRYKSVA